MIQQAFVSQDTRRRSQPPRCPPKQSPRDLERGRPYWLQTPFYAVPRVYVDGRRVEIREVLGRGEEMR